MLISRTKRATNGVPELHLVLFCVLLNIVMSQSKPVTVGQHYTVAEVANLLHVHEMTVRSWYRKNRLKIQRIGRKGVRIAATDLKVFLDQMQQDSMIYCQHHSGSTVAARQSGIRKKHEPNRKDNL